MTWVDIRPMDSSLASLVLTGGRPTFSPGGSQDDDNNLVSRPFLGNLFNARATAPLALKKRDGRRTGRRFERRQRNGHRTSLDGNHWNRIHQAQQAPPALVALLATRRPRDRQALEPASRGQRVRGALAPTARAPEPPRLLERMGRRHRAPERLAEPATQRRRPEPVAGGLQHQAGCVLRILADVGPPRADIRQMIRAPAREPRTRQAHLRAVVRRSDTSTGKPVRLRTRHDRAPTVGAR